MLEPTHSTPKILGALLPTPQVVLVLPRLSSAQSIYPHSPCSRLTLHLGNIPSSSRIMRALLFVRRSQRQVCGTLASASSGLRSSHLSSNWSCHPPLMSG